jgi:hypothetical protein
MAQHLGASEHAMVNVPWKNRLALRGNKNGLALMSLTTMLILSTFRATLPHTQNQKIAKEKIIH